MLVEHETTPLWQGMTDGGSALHILLLLALSFLSSRFLMVLVPSPNQGMVWQSHKRVYTPVDHALYCCTYGFLY